MKNEKETQRLKRRKRYQDFKHIESILHPIPKINGVEITHYHQGQYVYFSAWSGNDRVSGKVLKWERQRFLNMKPETKFYHLFSMDFEWLSKGGDI